MFGVWLLLGYSQLPFDLLDILRLRHERKIPDWARRPLISVRPVTGHLSIPPRASGSHEGFTLFDERENICSEIREPSCFIESHLFDRTQTFIDDPAGELDSSILVNGR